MAGDASPGMWSGAAARRGRSGDTGRSARGMENPASELRGSSGSSELVGPGAATGAVTGVEPVRGGVVGGAARDGAGKREGTCWTRGWSVARR